MNIKLKKTKTNSWNNTIRTTYKQATFPAFLFENSFNYQKNRFSILFDVSAVKGNTIYTNDINYSYPSEFWKSKVFNKTKENRMSTILNLGYKLSVYP